jgi:hypothetical protein
VAQRTQEIGIRMALGARPADVLALVVRRGMRLTFVGVAIGLVAALAVSRLAASLRCRPSPYLNNIVEQDHRFIKKRIAASLWFRSAEGALQTVAGYEAMHAIRKGQIRWLPKGDVVGQVQLIQRILGIAA